MNLCFAAEFLHVLFKIHSAALSNPSSTRPVRALSAKMGAVMPQTKSD